MITVAGENAVKITGGENMQVEVDPVLCESIGVCVRECPSIFSFREGSKKAVTPEGDVPPALEERVREVALMCPNRAIRIIE